MGLYFRRRQALCRAFTRLSNAYESVSGVPLLSTPASARVNARQKAWLGTRCAKVQQCWTFALYASQLQQFSQSCTGVTNWVCSGSSLQLRQWSRYGAISSSRRSRNLMRSWSRSKSSCDPAGQTEFFNPVSLLLLHTFNWLYSYRQLAVRTVVSAITVFWLVDNVISYHVYIFANIGRTNRFVL